ncbi:hypothetical protein NKH99_28765 [Mesorhizobium sp. M0854]|uniref:hypothetical protein n=1 Tax=Mesorhizobium sp. M0854 TaxID=2957013 RepID=UPI003336B336
MSEAGGYVGMRAGALPSRRCDWIAIFGFGANCRLDIPATVKVNPGEGGICIALDALGVRFGRAPTLLGGAVIGGTALVIGLHDDNSVSQ